MTKQAINVAGEQEVVREDTAKSHRGVYWALFSILGFVIIAAILFFGGFLATGGDIQSPGAIEANSRR